MNHMLLHLKNLKSGNDCFHCHSCDSYLRVYCARAANFKSLDPKKPKAVLTKNQRGLEKSPLLFLRLLQATIAVPWGHLTPGMVAFAGIPAMLHTSSTHLQTSQEPLSPPSPYFS